MEASIIEPKEIVYLATRDFDDVEKQTIETLNITVIETERLLAIDDILTVLSHCTEIYLYFDLDSLDPEECNGRQNFKVPEGTKWSIVRDLI